MKVIFVGRGRLGNQVFQYVAIRKLFGESAKILANGLQSLPALFERDPRLYVGNYVRPIEKLVRRVAVPALLRPLFMYAGVGTYCGEKLEMYPGGKEPSGEPNIILGRGKAWSFVDGVHLQNLTDLLEPADFLRLRVRPDVLTAATMTIRQACRNDCLPEAVVHVRRGDYLAYSAYGVSRVTLGVDYYERAFDEVRQLLGNTAKCLVVSDDPAWCREELSRFGEFPIVRSTEATDFAILTRFPIAVISNSTFSLAAVCTGPAVEKIIAPMFWFGHESKEWLPPKIRSSDPRFIYV